MADNPPQQTAPPQPDRPQGVGQDWKLLQSPSGDKMWFPPDQAKIGVGRGAQDVTPGQAATATASAPASDGGMFGGLKNYGKSVAHGALETLGSLDNTKFGKGVNQMFEGKDEAAKEGQQYQGLLDKTTPKPGLSAGLGKATEQGLEMIAGGAATKGLEAPAAMGKLAQLASNMGRMGAVGSVDAAAHHESPASGAGYAAGGETLGPVGEALHETVPGKIISGALRAGKSRFFGAEPAKELADSGITGLTTKSIIKKTGAQIGKNMDDVSAGLNSANQNGTKINASQAVTIPFQEEAKHLHDAGFDDASQNVLDHLDRLLKFYGTSPQTAKAKLTGLPVNDAQFLKTDRLQAIPAYSTASLKPGGDEAGGVKRAAKAAASNVRQAIEDKVPAVAAPNRHVHNLMEAQEALKDTDAANSARGWRPTVPELTIPALVGGFGHSIPAALAAYGVTRLGESVPAALAAAQLTRRSGQLLATPAARAAAEGAFASRSAKH